MNKYLRRAVACLLSLLLCAQLTAPAFAAGSTIYIDSADDLLALAENCSLDTWSQGKTVVLQADISLGSIDCAPIPTFGGTFDGGGHTISGMNLTGSLSPAGLFGILQESAVVCDLRLSGSVYPSGGSESVGGIAGWNGGLIENCAFSGSVSGEDSVGGIAGTNTLTGRVRNCTVAGSISGKSRTGGIVGTNLGVVSACRNDSYVNIASVDPSIDLTDLELDPTHRLFTLSSLGTVHVATDTGGIAGYSSGMVLSCVNNGVIGHQHIGYNVGGIAGRSCGYLADCVNQGGVFGRKDIGGIVGQAEPYVVLDLSPDTLQTIRSELDALQRLVNRAADSADASSTNISDRLSAINDTLGDATGYAEDLTDQLSDYGNDTITEINRGSDILADAMDRLDGISGKVTDLSEQTAKGIDRLEDAARELARAEGLGTEALRNLQEAADELKQANLLLEKGMEQVADGMKQLRDAVKVEDPEAAERALEIISTGLDELADAMGLLSDALSRMSSAPVAPEVWDELADAFSAAADGLEKLRDGTAALRNNISFDLDTIQAGMEQIMDGMKILSGIPARGSAAVGHLKDALSHGETAFGYLQKATETLADAADIFGAVSNDGTDIFADAEDLLDFLASADPIQIAHPDEGISNSADALYDTLEQLGDHMNLLNGTVTSASRTLTDDIRAIANQFHRVMDTAINAVYDAENASPEDRFSDTSQADIDHVTSGKILSCVNHAAVSGDIDTGGVAGTMAVEYELDPESEAFTSDAPLYRREYELKVILQNCANTGAVTGRRDYVGSICGRMDLGLVTECQGYGSAESESGDYVGGIAGFTTGTVLDSWAKCRLDGGKYIGGIVGSAGVEGSAQSVGEISRCRSLVRIVATGQYIGAIAGIGRGAFRDNLFVSDTLAGIDRVSTVGRAEPVSYQELLQTPGLPVHFRRFTLRFLAGDQALKTVFFDYGDSFDDAVFPDIPGMAGNFATWDTMDLTDLRFDTDVTAVYAPCITALPSEEQRDDGRPLFLVEGQFSDQDRLAVEQSGSPDADRLARGTPASLRRLVEQWQLDIPSDGLDAHTVRYLSPSGKTDRLEMYGLQSSSWRKLETETAGSYLKFDVPSGVSEIAVVSRTAIWWVWLLCAVVLAVVAVLLLLRRRAVKRGGVKKQAVLPPESSPKPVKHSKTHRMVCLLATLALLAGIGTAWFFASGMNDTVAACRLLHKYAQKPQLSMELTAQAELGEREFSTCAQLSRTELEGRRITYAEQYGVPLYYSDGLVFLENGKAFDTGDLFPDYSVLLESAEALYRAADISVYENSGETIYSITVADGAQALLAQLVPAATARLSVQGVAIDLVARGGELSAIRFSADGTLENDEKTPTAISVQLSVVEDTVLPEIPQAIRERILAGDAQAEETPTGDLLRLLAAWLKLNAEDPFAARLSLSANCGPLVLDDQLELWRTRQEGMTVSCIRKNGRSLYFTDNAACGEDGGSVSETEKSITSSADLTRIAYQLCISGQLSKTERDGTEIYTLTLDADGMADVAYAILPQAQAMDVTLNGGSIQITLAADTIQRIRYTCDGSVRVLFTDAAVSLTGDLVPEAPAGTFTVPDAVLETLRKEE